MRLGLTRYLAVPIRNPTGEAIGTLCFLDGQVEAPLGPDDVEFLSVLAMRVGAELERERMIERRVAEERAAAAARVAMMNAQLIRTVEEKRRLTATVVHDLRQPLAALLTVLHVLRGEVDPAERAECVDLLENRVTALGGLVDELLEYAQIEAGQVTWHVEQVCLVELLAGCLEEFIPEARALHVRVEFHLYGDPGDTWTDRTNRKQCYGRER